MNELLIGSFGALIMLVSMLLAIIMVIVAFVVNFTCLLLGKKAPEKIIKLFFKTAIISMLFGLALFFIRSYLIG
jgi:hypothetical protein